MIKEIRYKGFSEVPSDYECADGELASVVGMVPEDDGLRAVQEPKGLFVLPDGSYTVVFVHQNTGYKHYIIRHVGEYGNIELYWIDAPAVYTEYEATDFTSGNLLMTVGNGTSQTDNSIALYQVNALGHALIVQTSEGTYRIVWKGNSLGYKNLGNRLPELPISFGLQGELEWSDDFQFGFDTIMDYNLTDEFTDKNKDRISDDVLAKVNKFIAEHSTNVGKFMFPFFVRYAYRLTDQTLTMHSAPVLMAAASALTPQCFTLSWSYDDDQPNALYGARCKIAAIISKLDYQALISNAAKQALEEDWADIIESVDVFISAPIYTYNQNGKCERFMTAATDGYSVCKITNPTASGDYLNYKRQMFRSVYSAFYTGETPGGPAMWLELPSREADAIADSAKTSHFYLLKSIQIADLANSSRTVIGIPDDYLPALVNREQMTDDYDSHDQLISKASFTYNQRLSMSGLSKILFDGYDPRSMLAFTNGTPTTYKVRVKIEIDGVDYVVESGQNVTVNSYAPLLYLYYPNPHATMAYLIEVGSSPERALKFALRRHDGLRGAYYFGGFDASVSYTNDIPAVTTGNIVEMNNVLYTSEVANPFVFTSKGVQTIGTSRIVGIRPIVKALSPSQYGQFKMYVFAKDGVWSLETTSDGYLEHPQLTAEDVVLGDGESITQIDGAVLFASARGVMMISGSQVVCISEKLNSERPFVPFILAAEPQGTRESGGDNATEVQGAGATQGEGETQRSADNSYVGWKKREFTANDSPINITVEHNFSLLDDATPQLMHVSGMASDLAVDKFYLKGHKLGDAADAKVYFDQNWVFGIYGIDEYNDSITEHPRTDRVFHNVTNGHYYAYVNDHLDDLGTEDPTLPDPDPDPEPGPEPGPDPEPPTPTPTPTRVIDVLPGLSRIAGGYAETLQLVRFRNYLEGCRMLYDYVHQRIMLYNPEQPYAYVYAIKSQQWGMIASSMVVSLPSYPNAEVMVFEPAADATGTVARNAVVDYSQDTAADGERLDGLIITRPLKLDLPDALKTVTTIIQRGVFRKGYVKSILYASRDLQHWHLIWSSADHYLRGFSGTPYKYFRLALLCSLEKHESVDGCTVLYDPRLTDRLR